MKFQVFALALPLTLAGTLPAASPQDKGGAPSAAKPQEAGAVSKADQAVIDFQRPCYPLKTCVVSGEELGPDAVDTVIDGRLVRTCCSKCVAGAKKDIAATLAKIDAAVIAAQKKLYPLTKCPISGHDLGADALDIVVGTRLVRTCCKDCVADLKKSPDAAFKELADAYIAAQKPGYPLTTCVVSGEKLGGAAMGEPVDFLFGTHLFRLCCASCKKEILKNPDAAWAKVEAARVTQK